MYTHKYEDSWESSYDQRRTINCLKYILNIK